MTFVGGSERRVTSNATSTATAKAATTRALRALPMCLGLGLLTACPTTETGITDVTDPVRVLAQFDVQPALLTFGPVERDTFEVQQFTVSNIGETQIEIRTAHQHGLEFEITVAQNAKIEYGLRHHG